MKWNTKFCNEILNLTTYKNFKQKHPLIEFTPIVTKFVKNIVR